MGLNDSIVQAKQNIGVSRETLEQYIFSSGLSKLTTEQKEFFIQLAQKNSLDPFKREIHAIARARKEGGYSLQVVTGYEVYIKRAELSGKLDGWLVETEGSIQGKDLKAVITIYRKDWKNPFKYEVEYLEYYQPTPIWQSKPKSMLKKVAISQGFRMAFTEIGGFPYIQEELPEEVDQTNQGEILQEVKEIKEEKDVQDKKKEIEVGDQKEGTTIDKQYQKDRMEELLPHNYFLQFKIMLNNLGFDNVSIHYLIDQLWEMKSFTDLKWKHYWQFRNIVDGILGRYPKKGEVITVTEKKKLVDHFRGIVEKYLEKYPELKNVKEETNGKE
jgi:phage recombination protein Bet